MCNQAQVLLGMCGPHKHQLPSVRETPCLPDAQFHGTDLPVSFQRSEEEQGDEGPNFGLQAGSEGGLEQDALQKLHGSCVCLRVGADCVAQHGLAQRLTQCLAELHPHTSVAIRYII